MSYERQVLQSTRAMRDTEFPQGLATARLDAKFYASPSDEAGTKFPRGRGDGTVLQYDLLFARESASRSDMPEAFACLNGIAADDYSGQNSELTQEAIIRKLNPVGIARFSVDRSGIGSGAVAGQIRGIAHVQNCGEYNIVFGDRLVMAPCKLIRGPGGRLIPKYSNPGREDAIRPAIIPLREACKRTVGFSALFEASRAASTYETMQRSDGSFDKSIATLDRAVVSCIIAGIHASRMTGADPVTLTNNPEVRRRTVHIAIGGSDAGAQLEQDYRNAFRELQQHIMREWAEVQRRLLGMATCAAKPGDYLSLLLR